MKQTTNKKQQSFMEVIKRKANNYLPPSPDFLEREAILELLEEILDDSIRNTEEGEGEGEIAIRYTEGKVTAFEHKKIRTQYITLEGAHNEQYI